ncbi:MAG: hypothetical protein IJ553_00010 [Alloprevotella sp.]|nr:hypothetical protein [Alloprevotella sp.]
MTDENVLNQLRAIGAKHNWDVIEEVSELYGRPVYELRNSSIRPGAKTGEPHLYSYTPQGVVFELDYDEALSVIVSFAGLRKRIQ